MFKFVKKKVKEIKEEIQKKEVIFAEPITTEEAFKQSESIDNFIKKLNLNKNE